MTVAPSSPAAPASRLAGIGLYVLAFFVLALVNTAAKYATQFVPAFEVTWFRYAGHLLIMLVIVRPHLVLSGLRTRRPVLQVLRATCLAGVTFLSFAAMRTLDLATFSTILISTPLFVTALAGPVLGDWAGPRRWAAVLAGFLGVLVIMRPGPDGVDPGALLALSAVGCYAGYMLLTRLLTATESTYSMLLFTALVPTLAFTPALPAMWVTPPTLLVWVCLGLVAGLAALGHTIIVMAFRRAPATVLAPFQYSQVMWMPLLGFLVFADVPPVNTAIGGAIIVASGLYVLNRERLRHRTQRNEASDAI